MRIFLFLSFFLILGLNSFAQSKNQTVLYDPNADPLEQIELAVEKAKSENKIVLIQVGGNWCSWCIKLHNLIEEHAELDSIIEVDFEFTRVNYSKENTNSEVMEMLGFPNRFGFPVIVILNKEGERIHTQNTAYLEENKSYSKTKIREFLLSWNSKAIDPATYNK